jgi:response regulator of citrate/malate metabolism
MNKQRRKQIEKATALMQEALDILENVKDEEQDAFDNMPEGLQGSEKGELMEEIIDYLEDSYGNLEYAIEDLENIE